MIMNHWNTGSGYLSHKMLITLYHQRMQLYKNTLLRETQLFGGDSNRLIGLLKLEKYVCKMIYLFTHCFV